MSAAWLQSKTFCTDVNTQGGNQGYVHVATVLEGDCSCKANMGTHSTP